VFCIHYMLCLLQSWRFQLTALLRQTMQRVQNTWSITSLICSFKHAHICKHKREDVFESHLFKEIVWLLARYSPLTFLKYLKTFDFSSFALIISSDELQSKAQFNWKSLWKNKTGYLAENLYFFPQWKLPRKVHICLHWFFTPYR